MLERSLVEVNDLYHKSHLWDVEVCWLLTPRCNYSCSYCESYTSSGPTYLKTLNEYKDSVKYLKKYFGNKKIKIDFVGGEPTLFKDWDKLLSFCYEENIYTVMTTNLSMSYTTLVKKCLNMVGTRSISVSWHPSQIKNKDEMLRKIDFLNTKNLLRDVSILGDTRHWDSVKLAKQKLSYLGNIVGVDRIYDETSQNAIRKNPWLLSKNQEEFLVNNKSTDKNNYKLYVNKEISDIAYLAENNLLNFKGMYCAVGQNRIHIKETGQVYPSACLLNFPKSSIGNIFDKNLKKINNPIVCPFSLCSCWPDIRIEKHKHLEDFN